MKSEAAKKKGPVLIAKPFEVEASRWVKGNYLLFLPKGYDEDSGSRWPLIFFLHGAGERGGDVWKVAQHGPPRVAKEDPDFPFVVVSPQCPQGQIWSKESLLPLLEQVLAQYAVDPTRVYLTGVSMGGYGAWDLGLAHPEKFAALVPICGGGELINVLLSRNDPVKAQALKSLGVWVFHGAKDDVVPIEESERMMAVLRHEGVTGAKFTVYPDVRHDSWTQTYNNPELYKWLLGHSRDHP